MPIFSAAENHFSHQQSFKPNRSEIEGGKVAEDIFRWHACVKFSISHYLLRRVLAKNLDSEKVEESRTNEAVNLKQLSTPNDFVVFIFCAVVDASPSKCAKVQQNSRRKVIIKTYF